MKLIDYLAFERGRTKQLAAGLKVSASLLTQWARGKPVSAERCVPIERLTDGAVRRWDLRPDWREIWPELAELADAPLEVHLNDAAHSAGGTIDLPEAVADGSSGVAAANTMNPAEQEARDAA